MIPAGKRVRIACQSQGCTNVILDVVIGQVGQVGYCETCLDEINVRLQVTRDMAREDVGRAPAAHAPKRKTRRGPHYSKGGRKHREAAVNNQEYEPTRHSERRQRLRSRGPA